MNLNYNLWREECLSSLVENDELFVCVKCQGWHVKHPIWHYVRWHFLYNYIEPYMWLRLKWWLKERYTKQYPWLRLKRWVRNAYITLYNHTFDKRTEYMLKYMWWSSRRCEREKRVFIFKMKRTREWEALLVLERSVCMEVNLYDN
jgi:hypothetical protein